MLAASVRSAPPRGAGRAAPSAAADAAARRLAGASLLGTALFAAGALLMHALRPDLSPRDVAVSYYLNGPSGWVLGAGLVALGVGSLCLAVALWVVLPGSRGGSPARLGVGALAVWGVGATVGGVFAPDPMGHWDRPPSPAGVAHMTAAAAAFLAFPVAALRLAGPVGRLAHGPGLARRLRRLAAASVAALAAFVACLAPAFADRAPVGLGLAERVLLALYVAWLAAAAAGVRGAAGPAVATDRGGG